MKYFQYFWFQHLQDLQRFTCTSEEGHHKPISEEVEMIERQLADVLIITTNIESQAHLGGGCVTIERVLANIVERGQMFKHFSKN